MSTHTRVRHLVYGWYALSLCLILTTIGCQSGTKRPASSAPSSQPAITKVVVIGFRAAISEGNGPELIRNPITGTAFMSQPVSREVVGWLTQQLFERLLKEKKWRLVPPGQAEGVVGSIMKSDKQVGIGPLEMVQDTGKAFEADAVLIGQVYRWQERIGTDFGVERPASVAFDLSLISPSDGAILWRGNYDKTQQSLFENLFDYKTYFKSGGVWLTARKLADFGLDRLMAEMPGIRIPTEGPTEEKE